MKVFELLGWTGVVCVVLAYALLNFEAIEPKSAPYLLLNIFGSTGIIVSSSQKKDLQPVVLNAVWLFVALISLVRVFWW